MEAIVFDVPTKKLHLLKQDLPRITDPKQILVKIKYAGICGTDLHIIDGSFPCKEKPFILGHEFCGVAMEVGSDIKHISEGDRVVINPNRSCDVCKNCTSGLIQHCATGGLNSTIGIYRDGGWAEYCVVPGVQAYQVPDNVPFEIAVLCEPISCISHGLDRISPISFGDKILITGAGIIGSLWVCLLHLQGHKNVTISEPNVKRIELLKKLETNYKCVTPHILEENKNNFNLIIDCSGSTKALEQSFSLLAPNGKLCVFGVADPKEKIEISPYEIFKKELTIVGVVINPFSFMKALAYLESLGEKYLDYGKLGIKTYNLGEYEDAIKDLRQGNIAKAMFRFD